MLKRFENFSNSNSNTEHVIDSIIIYIQNLSIFKDMVKSIIEYIEKEYDRKVSKLDEELIKAELIFDLVKALNKHLNSNDIAKDITIKRDKGNKIIIDLTITRDGKDYPFSTNVIYAGGHNIQRLHYRYLISTNLPSKRSIDKDIENVYKEKVKSLTKKEKLLKEIESFEKRIIKMREEIEYYSSFTDSEILDFGKEKDGYNFDITWEEIIKRGADKNYDSEEDFNKKQDEYKDSMIKSFKSLNIISKQRSIDSLTKEIAKNRKKLENI